MATEQGRYVSLSVSYTVSTRVVGNRVDAGPFKEAFGSLITKMATLSKRQQRRVAIFGEGAHFPCAQGNTQALIEDGRICKELSKMYEVDMLCGYFVGSVRAGIDHNTVRRICTEHSAGRAG